MVTICRLLCTRRAFGYFRPYRFPTPGTKANGATLDRGAEAIMANLPTFRENWSKCAARLVSVLWGMGAWSDEAGFVVLAWVSVVDEGAGAGGFVSGIG